MVQSAKHRQPLSRQPIWRRGKFWMIASVLAAVVAIGGVVYMIHPSQPPVIPIRVSRETTYVTEPLKPYGMVDYPEVLRRRLGPPPAAEDNAAVLLLDVTGDVNGSSFGREDCARAREMLHLPQTGPAGLRFVSMSQLFQARTAPPGTLGAPVETSEDDWEKFYQANAPALDQAVKASRCPNLYLPFMDDTWARPHVGAIVLLEFGGLSAYLGNRAFYRSGKGQTDEAWEDFFAAIRLARLLSQVPFGDSLMTAQYKEHQVLQMGQFIARSGTLSESQAKAALEQLRALPPAADAGPHLELARLQSLYRVTLLARDGLEHVPRMFTGVPDGQRIQERGIDWNPAMELINRTFDRIDQAAGIKTFEERWTALAEIKHEMDQWAKQYDMMTSTRPARRRLFNNESPQITLLRENIAADPARAVAANVMSASSVSLISMNESNRIRVKALEVRLTLAAWKAKNGRYPNTLEELCPEFFESVPVDESTGKPFEYSAEGGKYTLRTGLDVESVAPASRASE